MVDQKSELINKIIEAMSTTLSSDNLNMLDNVLRKFLADVNIEKADQLPSVGVDQSMQLLKMFLAARKLQGIKDSTLQQYYYTCKRLISSVNKPVIELTRNDLRLYAVQLRKTMNELSLDNQITYIAVFFEWLRDEGYVNKNPAKNITNCKPQYGILPSLTANEVIDIAEAAETPIEKAMTSFLLSTGVRCGELREILIDDVDMHTGRVHLISEKSDRPREVFLTPRAKRDVQNYIDTRTDSDPHLFVSLRKIRGEDGLKYRQISSYAIERIVKDLGVRAGIQKKVTVHVFRRTLGTSLINNGCPVEVIQRLLGHASPETTLTYYAELNSDSIQQNFNRYVKTV